MATSKTSTTAAKTTAAKVPSYLPISTPAKASTPTPTKKPATSTNAAATKALTDLMTSEQQLVGLLGTLSTSLSSGTGTSGGRTDASYMAEGRSGTSTTGQNYIEGKAVSPAEFNAWLYGTNADNASAGKAEVPTGPSAETQDAFAALGILFKQYGLEGLSSTITSLMTQGLTPGEATIKLKYDTSIDPSTGKAWNAAYTTRFSGNTKRTAAGLNALTEAEYITLEDSYANTLKAYGLGNMLSTDRTINEATFAKYIGSDISAPEFKDRIATVEDRVVNADPTIKETFKTWYPNITDSDLVAYFLDPSTTIGKLKEKATAAEIGAAATGQGLTASKTTAEDLAAYGIDRAGALTGYASVASVLPKAQELSNIYKSAGIEYNQSTAESEFFKTNQDAAEKRKQLKSLERASFSGESGVGKGSLARSSDF